jgi:hypothetical protein
MTDYFISRANEFRDNLFSFTVFLPLLQIKIPCAYYDPNLKMLKFIESQPGKLS